MGGSSGRPPASRRTSRATSAPTWKNGTRPRTAAGRGEAGHPFSIHGFSVSRGHKPNSGGCRFEPWPNVSKRGGVMAHESVRGSFPPASRPARKPFLSRSLRRFAPAARNQESWARPGAYTLSDGSGDPDAVRPETLGGTSRNRLVRRQFRRVRAPRNLRARGWAPRAWRPGRNGSFSKTHRGLMVEV